MRRIEILDTTLRDGAQGEGVSFAVEDKLKIMRALDEMGVDVIEAGNPGASRRDMELTRYASDQPFLRYARLAAFGATCRAGAKANEDAGLQALLACGAKTLSLVGKSWGFQVDAVLKVTREENLRMIRDSVRLLAQHEREVLFDAEHFFDGFYDDREYALETLRTALSAGARTLVLCDTNGGMLPEKVAEAVRETQSALGAPLGIHCHNDAGLATACTLSAVEAGAGMAQGSVNGYGERCGNANLCEILPNLTLKMGLSCLREGALTRLTATARLIGEVANMALPERAPYVGRSAFAHKGGMHIDGMLKDKRSFEHESPEAVGNARRYLVSEISGRGALMTRLRALAPDVAKDSPQAYALTEMLKSLEAQGYTFEDADGSLELRLLGALGRRASFFEVLDFHVVSRKPEDDKNAQAYVKVRVGDAIEITADEGDGPVNALDLAVRKALSKFYPCLGNMRLLDFKVRVIDTAGTASKVRVHMESGDGRSTWATVGVSGNVIEASFVALTDAIEVMLMNEWRRSASNVDSREIDG